VSFREICEPGYYKVIYHISRDSLISGYQETFQDIYKTIIVEVIEGV